MAFRSRDIKFQRSRKSRKFEQSFCTKVCSVNLLQLLVIASLTLQLTHVECSCTNGIGKYSEKAEIKEQKKAKKANKYKKAQQIAKKKIMKKAKKQQSNIKKNNKSIEKTQKQKEQKKRKIMKK